MCVIFRWWCDTEMILWNNWSKKIELNLVDSVKWVLLIMTFLNIARILHAQCAAFITQLLQSEEWWWHYWHYFRHSDKHCCKLLNVALVKCCVPVGCIYSNCLFAVTVEGKPGMLCFDLSYIINIFLVNAVAIINLAQLRVNCANNMFVPDGCIYRVINYI